MRSRRSSARPSGGKHGRPPGPSAVPPAELRKRYLSGPRGLAIAAVVSAALVGTVFGVATAAANDGAPANLHGANVAGSRHLAPKTGAHDNSPAKTAGTGTNGTGAKGIKTPAAQGGALRTSCQSVAHIGDSTSLALVSTTYGLSPSQLVQARYEAVGVRNVWQDASGGRSIVETLPGQVNGFNVARNWASQGYKGCWVIALGTNDAANVAVGSSVSPTARIDEIMAVAHGSPVLWVNTRTELGYGAYANANEQAWDAALVKALARYPNMRIFDWSSVAQPGWFFSDGIHYNTSGSVIRAQAIADALAKAFPLNGHSNGQIVR